LPCDKGYFAVIQPLLPEQIGQDPVLVTELGTNDRGRTDALDTEILRRQVGRDLVTVPGLEYQCASVFAVTIEQCPRSQQLEYAAPGIVFAQRVAGFLVQGRVIDADSQALLVH
jgi:hypothetical protein